MRILLGTIDIANQMRPTTKHLNSAGHPTRFCDASETYLEYQGAEEYRVKEPNMNDYDVFDIYFGSFPLHLKDHLPASLKLVHHFCGSDVRRKDVAEEQNEFAACKTNIDVERIKKLADLSDVCYIKDHELYDHVAGHFRKVYEVPRLVEGELNPQIPIENDRPLIVHAPTNRDVKGTDHVINVIDKLRKSFTFDFRLISGFSHSQAMSFYRRADIVIDQLRIGTYGQLAMECMALGKPVVSYISPYMKKHLPSDLPIVSASPLDLGEKLALMLRNPENWSIIGMNGIEYVRKYHSPEVVIPKLLKVYEDL